MRVNPGALVRIKLGDQERMAGMVKRNGLWEIAFKGKASDFAKQTHCEVDGKRWKIDLCERSDQAKRVGPGVPGFVRLTVSPIVTAVTSAGEAA